jgi:hypothetical protein
MSEITPSIYEISTRLDAPLPSALMSASSLAAGFGQGLGDGSTEEVVQMKRRSVSETVSAAVIQERQVPMYLSS